MSIDESTAAKVAKLARIKVEDADLPALAQEFNTILGFIEQLGEVDVEGVEPMVSVTPMRLKRRRGYRDGRQSAGQGSVERARRPRRVFCGAEGG
jgi:aspartyl-tRNA(Asn)/glutamyl-tRNA(Gln) amidotransferase subunit C